MADHLCLKAYLIAILFVHIVNVSSTSVYIVCTVSVASLLVLEEGFPPVALSGNSPSILLNVEYFCVIIYDFELSK